MRKNYSFAGSHVTLDYTCNVVADDKSWSRGPNPSLILELSVKIIITF